MLVRKKKRFKLTVAVSLVLFSLFLLTALMYNITAKRSGNRKVLLIGIDALTWKIISPLIEEGKLPNIKRLIDNGSYGKLESIEPMASPSLWTTIATGKVFEKHGIQSYAETVPGFSESIPVTSNMRKCKAIWNILTGHKKRSVIIDYYVTYPPEEIKGVMISRLTYFPTWIKSKEDLLRKQRFPCMVFPASEEKKVNRIVSRLDLLEGSGSAVLAFNELKILESVSLNFIKERWDFLALYTPVIDGSGHHFWKYMEPEKFKDPRWGVAAEDIGKYGNIIRELYVEADYLIGRLLAKAGKDTITFIISDHGMKAASSFEYDPDNPSRRPDLCDSGTHDLYDGVIIVSGPGIKNGFRLEGASVLDITPTILYLFDLPIGRDMDGKVLTGILKDSFIEEHPVKYIDTYETRIDPNKDRAPVSSPFDKEIIERLKSLGYLH